MIFSFEIILRTDSDKYTKIFNVENKFLNFSLATSNCIFVFCFGIYPKPYRGMDFNFGILGIEIDLDLNPKQ